MGFEDNLRECIDAYLALTRSTLATLAKKAGIPPTSLQRFRRKERSLKTPSIIALVDAMGLKLVLDEEGRAARAEEALVERHQQEIHAIAERARRATKEIDELVSELASMAGSRH
jgi:hypothetical protein